MSQTTIYMPLLDEGTDAWAPVTAEHVAGSIYRILGPMPLDQQWQFAPEGFVSVRQRTFSDGDAHLAATGEAPGASSPEVRSLLLACPFLVGRIDLDGPYVAMGSTARLILERALSDVEIDQVFSVLSELAERDDADLDLLGTGALELFNDDAPTARLARRKLTGKALDMVEELRVGWGQPDYRE